MKKLTLLDWGSFHIGGRFAFAEGLGSHEVRYSETWSEAYEADGTYAVGAMYVQYFVPENAYGRPVIFWPGGGMSGANFETTPDGRPGWLDDFLRHGHAVYNVDPVERGRSGWAMYPQLFKSDPVFMSAERAYESFRFGEKGGYHADPSKRQAFAGTQFPIEAFDTFVKQIVPRWTTTGPDAKAAMQALLEKLGGAIVIAFSSGATQALQLAEQHPELFDALIMIEPAGTGINTDATQLINIPMLAVFGDFLDRHTHWPDVVERLKTWLKPCLGSAGKAEFLNLPSVGIYGNSHFMMMDRNNLEISQRLRDWINTHVNPHVNLESRA